MTSLNSYYQPSYLSDREEEQTHQCIYSEDFYPESEMVFDGDSWIAKIKIDQWLKYIESSMFNEDFENYKTKLLKQI